MFPAPGAHEANERNNEMRKGLQESSDYLISSGLKLVTLLDFQLRARHSFFHFWSKLDMFACFATKNILVEFVSSTREKSDF